MRKFLTSPLFRSLVCFLVICCMFFSYMAIPSRATAVGAAAVSLSALLAWLFSAAIGVVAIDLTVESLNKIGTDFKSNVFSDADSSAVSAYEDLEQAFINYLSSDHLDSTQWVEDLYAAFTSDTLKSTAAWLCDVVRAGGFGIVEEAAANYIYYNDVLLLAPPSDWDETEQSFLYESDGTYYFCRTKYTSNVLFVDQAIGALWSRMPVYRYTLVDNAWVDKTTYSAYSTSGFTVPFSDIIWSSDDVKYLTAGASTTGATGKALSGTDLSPTYTNVVVPTYVGDIAQSIIEGKKDEESLSIPVVDPFTVVASPATAKEDVKAIIADLGAGTISLDDYLAKVRADALAVSPDATTPGTGTDTWEPPEEIGTFTLDLRKVFPFCIPFDLYDLLSCLNAAPVAPVIQWQVPLPGGGSCPIELDLSPFDSVAQLLRRLQLLLFVVGLAIKTRDLIKG